MLNSFDLIFKITSVAFTINIFSLFYDNNNTYKFKKYIIY